MKQYRVVWARAETKVWEYEVEATDETHARRIAEQLNGNDTSEGKVVVSDEWCNEIEEV